MTCSAAAARRPRRPHCPVAFLDIEPRAALLPDGRVLVTGGSSAAGIEKRAEMIAEGA